MKYSNVFFPLVAIFILAVGIAHAADYDSKRDNVPLSPGLILCFEDSYMGDVLQIDYDQATQTLTGTFSTMLGDVSVYGIYYNKTLVWSFDIAGIHVTYVGKIVSRNPLTFETYWVTSSGAKDGPYTLTRIPCP